MIFQGLNFSRNADIGQIRHFWKGMGYALYQAALIASYDNEGFRRLCHRKVDGRQGERGINAKARVKPAAKLLVIESPSSKGST